MSISPKPIEELQPLLDQLISPDYLVRIQGADKLKQMGKQAENALQNIWDAFEIETQDQVRTRMFRAIQAITNNNSMVIEKLKSQIQDSDYYKQIGAIGALAEIGPEAQSVLPVLFDLLKNNRDQIYQQTLSRAILAIELDKTRLITAIESILAEPIVNLFPFLDQMARANLSDSDKQRLLADLWQALETNVDSTSIADLVGSIFRLFKEKEQFFDQLVKNQQIAEWKKGYVFYTPYLVLDSLYAFQRWWAKDRELVLGLALIGLRDQFASYSTSMFLQYISQSISEDERERVLIALEDSIKTYGVGFEALGTVGGTDRVKQVIAKLTGPFDMVGRYLINTRHILEDLWEKDKEIVIRCLLPLIQSGVDWEVSPAADWLRDNAEQIPNNRYNAVIKALQPIQNESPEIRTKKEAVLIQMKQYERKILQKPLFEVLDGDADVDSKNEAVQKLLQLKSREITRTLVSRWVQWIAYGNEPLLAETTTENLRTSSQAVLPLVEHFLKKLELDNNLKWYIFQEEIPSSYFALIKEAFPQFRDEKYESTQQDFESQTHNLLDTLEDRSDTFKHLKSQVGQMRGNWMKIVEKIMEQLFQEELSVREGRVRQRIVKQLADMSDTRFFDINDQDTQYKEIQQELSKHAVPVMASRIPKEADIDIRENSARLLGNINGRESIDALVLAVVGEERTRAARQELLAKYYLDPAKKQGEDAAQILARAVNDARQTLQVLRWLNIAVFIVGILLLLTGTITALFNQEQSTRLIGVLAGLGGLSGILVQMINSPLDRIQNAMANLVQIETAFTSFIWELNLNGTFIQSQYVHEGILTDDEIGKTVKRIEDAMSLAMNQVSVYTKVGQQRVISRIYGLSPSAGPTGSTVIINGQHLTGDKTEKKEETGILAINHQPIKAENLRWKDQEVSFKLPNKINGDENFKGTIWMSLLVDGMETNALPFTVIEEGK